MFSERSYSKTKLTRRNIEGRTRGVDVLPHLLDGQIENGLDVLPRQLLVAEEVLLGHVVRLLHLNLRAHETEIERFDVVLLLEAGVPENLPQELVVLRRRFFRDALVPLVRLLAHAGGESLQQAAEVDGALALNLLVEQRVFQQLEDVRVVYSAGLVGR